MADCGALEYVRGGMIAEAHVTASSVTDSRISSSVIQSSELQTLTGVDNISAQVIAEALAKLPACALLELGQALMESGQAKLSSGPDITREESLPTAVAGKREMLLGEPAAWLEFYGYVIPAYKAEQTNGG